MNNYLNGINYENLVTGAGLVAGTATDQYGNLTLAAAAAGGGAVASQSLPLSQFASTTSAQLAGVISDETGSGSAVFGTAPTLNQPVIVSSGALAVSTRGFVNAATAAQAPAAATRTYITGSAIGPFTAGTIAVGTVFKWAFDITKTAAGSATSTFDIAFGTAGTTADTAYVSFTKPAGTAVGDQGWVEITAVVKTASATGVVLGNFRLGHNLAATGHAQIPFVSVLTTSGSVNLATPTFAGICITTGASDAITINQVDAQAIGL